MIIAHDFLFVNMFLLIYDKYFDININFFTRTVFGENFAAACAARGLFSPVSRAMR